MIRAASWISFLLLIFMFGCEDLVIVNPEPESLDYQITFLPETQADLPDSPIITNSTSSINLTLQLVNSDIENISLIMVSVSQQKLRAFVGGVCKEMIVSTAAGNLNVGIDVDPEEPHNHLGEFFIQRKDIDHISGVYDCPMPYAMFFYKGHAIHATTPDNYHKLGTPASHGCVRLHLDDAKWLFERTPIGTKVVITH